MMAAETGNLKKIIFSLEAPLRNVPNYHNQEDLHAGGVTVGKAKPAGINDPGQYWLFKHLDINKH